MNIQWTFLLNKLILWPVWQIFHFHLHLNPAPSISFCKDAFWLLCVWSGVWKAFWVPNACEEQLQDWESWDCFNCSFSFFFLLFLSRMQILGIHFLQWTGWCQTWGTTCWKCRGNLWVILKIILKFIVLGSASYSKYFSENNAKKKKKGLILRR